MNKILELLLEKGHVYEHDFEDKKEYRNFVKKVSHLEEDKEYDKYAVKDSHFETYAIPFEEDENKFVCRVMIGQGTAIDLFTEKEWEKWKNQIYK